MTRLAFANVEGVVVDPREVQRSGPSYTIDTLIELQSQYPGTQLVLIIGGDQAAAFEQWHRKDEILQIAIISVADRANAVPVGLAPELQHLPGGRLERLQLPLMPVSATDIRQRVSTHMGITDLVPAQVARYIDQHHLYQSA